MEVKDQKELWEAFRNKEREIVCNPNLAPAVKKWYTIKNVYGWPMVIMSVIPILLAVMLGRLLNDLGEIGGGGGNGWLLGAPIALIGLILMILGIVIGTGKCGGIIGELAKYRAKEEFGVVTLTRKAGK
jgi:hypothetical protein